MGQPAFEKSVLVCKDDNGEPDGEWSELPATDADMTNEGDVLDDTDLRTDGTRSRVIGIMEWSVNTTLNFEPGDPGYDTVRVQFNRRRNIWVRYLPDGTTDYGFEGPAKVENFSNSGSVDDLETVEANLASNGELLSTQTYDLIFEVVDESDEPVSGATVSLEGVRMDETQETDAEGEAVFEVIELQEYDYIVEDDGKEDYEGYVEIDFDDKTVEVTLIAE